MRGATSTSTWCRRQGRTERRSGRTSTRGSVLLMNQGYLAVLSAERASGDGGSGEIIAACAAAAGGDEARACSAPGPRPVVETWDAAEAVRRGPRRERRW